MLADLVSSNFSLLLNMFLMNLLTNFVHNAEVGHKSVLNLSFKDKVAKFGFKHSNFLNKQFRSAVNIGHWTNVILCQVVLLEVLGVLV